MKRALVLLALVATAAHAQQDWAYAAETDEAVIWGNLARMEHVQGGVKMWFKSVLKPHLKDRPVDHTDPKSKRYTEALQFVRVHCQARTMATVSAVFRDAKGSVVYSELGNEYAVRPVIPDSVGDGMHQLACLPR